MLEQQSAYSGLCGVPGTKQAVKELVDSLNSAHIDDSTEVVVSPTFVHLPHVIDNLRKPYEIAAQNCWVEGTGAYTGEVCTRVPRTACTCAPAS